MDKRKRVLIDNAAYHITQRGNQRQNVFLEEKDYSKYLQLLKKFKKRHEVLVYAYCLMKNHVHILVAPSDKSSLHKVLHGLSMSYAKYYNYKYDKCGHLWETRYKSYVIQKDQYLINCAGYIETNPLRSKICQRPEDYPWSSYKSRALGQENAILDNYIV